MGDNIIGKKIELYQPLFKVKGNEGVNKYEAVLSDNSLDRDNEIVGKTALENVQDSDIIVGLMDHENKILNQVCVWQNKRIEKRKGHTALVSEPKFFLSNPNANIVKGMLDEGAPMGVSIGAIVKDYEMKKIDGKEIKVYTKIEILEASFVAVPANKHAGVYAVAKMFKTKEEKNMTDKTYSEKEFNDMAKKAEDFEKQISDSKTELDKVLAEKVVTDKESADLKAASKVADTEKDTKISGLEKDLEKKAELEKEMKLMKESPLYKGYLEHDEDADAKKATDMKDSLEKGMIPIVRR